MRIARAVLVVFASLLLAAHFLRSGLTLPAAFCLALPGLLVVRASWGRWALVAALGAGCLEWLRTAFALAEVRRLQGLPATRMLVILSAVAVVTALAAVLSGRRVEPMRAS